MLRPGLSPSASLLVGSTPLFVVGCLLGAGALLAHPVPAAVGVAALRVHQLALPRDDGRKRDPVRLMRLLHPGGAQVLQDGAGAAGGVEDESATTTSPGWTSCPAQTTDTFTQPRVLLTVPRAETVRTHTRNPMSSRARMSYPSIRGQPSGATGLAEIGALIGAGRVRIMGCPATRALDSRKASWYTSPNVGQ